MNKRGWKYRCYADEPDETPVQDLVCCLLGGVTGFYSFPGWLLVSAGILSQAWALAIGAIIGLLFWGWLIYEGAQERREEKKQSGR
jgi:hypothetical protein